MSFAAPSTAPVVDVPAISDRIRAILMRRLPAKAAAEMREDMWIEALHHVLRVLPRFDPARRDVRGRPIRLALWVDTVVRNFINGRIRSLTRKEARLPMVCESQAPENRKTPTGEEDGGIMGEALASDWTEDAMVERAAANIMEHPEKFLSPRQTEIFKAIINAPPGTTFRSLARKLGLRHDSSFSNIFARLVKRLGALDIEEVASEFGESTPIKS